MNLNTYLLTLLKQVRCLIIHLILSERLRKELDSERKLTENKLLQRDKFDEESRLNRENQVRFPVTIEWNIKSTFF